MEKKNKKENDMIYKYQTPLQVRYEKYLQEHQATGLKTYPDKLLALLLLQEKENYHPENLTNGEFYEKYQLQIEEKINQGIKDFNLTKEDIISFIEKKGVIYREETYEEDKIWFVFYEGFGAIIGTQRYQPSCSPEQAYENNYTCFFGQYRKEPTIKRQKAIKKERHKRLIRERKNES